MEGIETKKTGGNENMGIKNTLTDLNNHLFAEIERLSDEDLQGEQLMSEIDRAKAVGTVAQHIIANGKLALEAEQFKSDYSYGKPNGTVPAFLESKGDEDA